MMRSSLQQYDAQLREADRFMRAYCGLMIGIAQGMGCRVVRGATVVYIMSPSGKQSWIEW